MRRKECGYAFCGTRRRREGEEWGRFYCKDHQQDFPDLKKSRARSAGIEEPKLIAGKSPTRGDSSNN